MIEKFLHWFPFKNFEAYNNILLNKVAKPFDDLPLDSQGRVVLYVQ